MSNRRIPDPQALWDRHVEAVLRVLSLALDRLHAENVLPLDEKAIDRRLSLMARIAYHSLSAEERPQSFALQRQAEPLPVGEEDVNAQWVGKKPDFKWRMQDDLASRPEDLTKDFDIECKRLGKPTSPRWVLTKQYVLNGIGRFLRATHRYGNGVSSGAMIGYVQDSQPSDILAEVNSYIEKARDHAIPPLGFPGSDFGTEVVMRTSQELDRVEVTPPDFVLHHLWVDLRGN